MHIEFTAPLNITGLGRVPCEISGNYTVTKDAYATGDSPTFITFEDSKVFLDDGTQVDESDFDPGQVLYAAVHYMGEVPDYDN